MNNECKKIVAEVGIGVGSLATATLLGPFAAIGILAAVVVTAFNVSDEDQPAEKSKPAA